MKIYLGIKFHADNSNRGVIEEICTHLNELGHEVSCITKDLEKWGETTFSPRELMEKTFEIIDHCDIVLIEFSEKGVGLGIEAGYAFSKGIPVHIVAKNGSDISNTISGIAAKINFYERFSEIEI